MSEKRCCCNCRRCLRIEEKGHTNTYCKIDGHYIGYVQCFEGWCRHWASDEKYWEEKGIEVDYD